MGGSTASTICGFGKNFVELGGSVGVGLNAGASTYAGQETDGTPIGGASMTLGIGEGVASHDDWTYTSVSAFYGRKACS